MSLYELERTGDVQELIRAIRESDNDRVRPGAELLRNFPDHDDRQDVVSALVRAAQDENDDVAAKAVDSLDELGGDAIEQLIGNVAGVDLDRDGAEWVKAKAFVEALGADVPELRMAAANGLGHSNRARPSGSWRTASTTPTPRPGACGPRLRQDSRSAGDGSPGGLLTDRSGEVRREAADALGSIGNRQALQALLPLYEDDNDRVRQIAVGGFGSFENDRPVDYLVAALSDDSPTVRRTAVYSLVELLSNVPTERSHDIRETVVEKLSQTDDASVVVPLVEILEESTQGAQRRNTAWLLGRVTGEEERRRVIDALVTALGEDDQMSWQFAATSLAEIDGEEVEDPLLAIIKDGDRDPEVRAQAIFTLGKVGGERSREALDAIIDDTDHETIRKRAFRHLQLGGRR